MDKEKFIDELTSLMDTEFSLKMDTKLSDVEEWDSLSIVSFISFCNMKFNHAIESEKVKAAQTVEDLFKLIGEK